MNPKSFLVALLCLFVISGSSFATNCRFPNQKQQQDCLKQEQARQQAEAQRQQQFQQQQAQQRQQQEAQRQAQLRQQQEAQRQQQLQQQALQRQQEQQRAQEQARQAEAQRLQQLQQQQALQRQSEQQVQQRAQEQARQAEAQHQKAQEAQRQQQLQQQQAQQRQQQEAQRQTQLRQQQESIRSQQQAAKLQESIRQQQALETQRAQKAATESAAANRVFQEQERIRSQQQAAKLQESIRQQQAVEVQRQKEGAVQGQAANRVFQEQERLRSQQQAAKLQESIRQQQALEVERQKEQEAKRQQQLQQQALQRQQEQQRPKPVPTPTPQSIPPQGTVTIAKPTVTPAPAVSRTAGMSPVILGNGQQVFVNAQGAFFDASGSPISNQSVANAKKGTPAITPALAPQAVAPKSAPTTTPAAQSRSVSGPAKGSPPTVGPPSTKELERYGVEQLAAMPKEQLVNLSADRRKHLDVYLSAKADAAKYAAEAAQYKKIENALAPLEKPAQVLEKAGDAAQYGLIAVEAATTGGLGAAPAIAAKKAEKKAIAKAGEYVVGKFVQRGVAKEVEANALRSEIGAASTRLSKPGVATANTVASGANAIEKHHLLPQAFKAQFERAGLDIEKYTVNISKESHRLKPDGLHASRENWNKDWRDFFSNNPSATQDQMLNQLDRMRRDPRYKDKLI